MVCFKHQVMETVNKAIVPFFSRSLTSLDPILDKTHEERSRGDGNLTTIYKLLAPIDGHMIHGNTNGMDTFLDVVIPFGIVCYIKNYWGGERKLFNSVNILPAGKQYAIVLPIPKKEERLKIKRGDELGALWFINREVDLKKFNNPGKPPIRVKTLILSIGCEQTIVKYQRRFESAFAPINQQGSAGIDLPSSEKIVIPSMAKSQINTGISFSLPFGHFGLIKARSGWADKSSFHVLAGVIDNNYW